VSWWGLLGAVVLGLLVNEISDVSPWMAGRLVRSAAILWSHDPHVAADYAEEWQAVVDERPGKLLKLGTALGFLAVAARIRLGTTMYGRHRAVRYALRGIIWNNWLMGVAGTAMFLTLFGGFTSGHMYVTVLSAMVILGFVLASGLEIRLTIRRRRAASDRSTR
jgi:hypothetical protein